MPIDEFLDRFSELEIQEHIADMNDGGDQLEKIAYFSRLTAQLLHSIYVWCGNSPLPEKSLNPWSADEEKPKIELPDMTDNDPLREALRARIKATEHMRKNPNGNE